MIFSLEDQLSNIIHKKGSFLMIEIFLNEFFSDFSTIFFIGFWSCIIDKIMEEKSYFNCYYLFFFQTLSYFLKLRRSPFLENGKNVIVGMIKSPELRVRGQDLIPPPLPNLIFRLLMITVFVNSLDHFNEKAFILYQTFCSKSIFLDQMLPNYTTWYFSSHSFFLRKQRTDH